MILVKAESWAHLLGINDAYRRTLRMHTAKMCSPHQPTHREMHGQQEKLDKELDIVTN